MIYIKHHDQTHYCVRIVGCRPSLNSAMRYGYDYFRRHGGVVQLTGGREIYHTFGHLREV